MKIFLKKILIWKMSLVARLVILKKKPNIIVVAGSVGKTSTKDAIFCILEDDKNVIKSTDNARTNLAAMYALLGRSYGRNRIRDMIASIIHGAGVFVFGGEYPKTIIIELSAKKKGDIKKISKWLHPFAVVVTRIPDVPAHVEYFKNTQDLIEEKIEIAKSIRKDGFVVLNADDENVISQKEVIKAKTYTYGFSENVDIHGSNLQIVAPDELNEGGITFKTNFDDKSFPVMLNNIYSPDYAGIALSALAVGYAMGVNMVESIARLAEYETPAGRSKVIRLDNKVTIIDDSYDSSPIACQSALKMLKDLPFGKRKIAVLGDMIGLGKFTESSHFDIGKDAKKYSTILVTVGLRAKKIAEGAVSAKMKKVFEAETSSEAALILQKNIKAHDVVLVKGARIMEMEKIIVALK